ncbi:hypothetical protein OIU74_008572 [Salix koriyanagi]|uniref:Uncharacterized protein n=1 Tax=Salix koriyanagi TaxID=2511006 RepID=A0A9Q0TQ96_9ROSI|nr:hypothetical protein OIU74_008572 [Salix koriyanagi]
MKVAATGCNGGYNAIKVRGPGAMISRHTKPRSRVWSWEVGGRDWVDFAFQALIALVGGLKAGCDIIIIPTIFCAKLKSWCPLLAFEVKSRQPCVLALGKQSDCHSWSSPSPRRSIITTVSQSWGLCHLHIKGI